jgi:hypothetical protein
MQVKRGIPRKICLDLGQGSRILSFLESSLDGEINQVFNQEDAVTLFLGPIFCSPPFYDGSGQTL